MRVRTCFYLVLFLLAIAITALTGCGDIRTAESSPSASPMGSPMASPPPSPMTNPSPSIKSPDFAIKEAISRLSKGEAYANVPDEMQVGASVLIEAGISPDKVTDEQIKAIQGTGEVRIYPGVRYDPAKTNMKLVVNPDEFKVFQIKGGEQFVSSSIPAKWIWEVTPLKEGKNAIAIEATVDLNVPKLKTSHLTDFEVFRATRLVKVNWSYNLKSFLTTNWKEIFGIVFGSGSMVSLILWWTNKKEKSK